MEFKNLAELKNKALEFERAEYRRVFDENKTENTGYLEVFNVDTNSSVRIIRSSSARKVLIQHKEIVDAFIGACLKNNLSLNGNIDTARNQVIIKCYLNEDVNKVGDETIRGGFFIVNDYNSGTKVGWYGGNLACMNDMQIKSLRCSIRVNDIQALPAMTEEAIYNVGTKTIQVMEEIEESREESLPIVAVKNLVKTMAIPSILCEELLVYLSELNKETVSRWEFYNALTYLATHSGNIKKNQGQAIQLKAETCLMKTRWN